MRDRGLALACAFAFLAGCASYEAPASLDQIEQSLGRFDFEDAELRLSVIPLAEKGPAQKFLGVDPVEVQLVPVMIEFENRSGGPLKLVPASLALRIQGGAALSAIDIHEAFVRARTAESAEEFGSG